MRIAASFFLFTVLAITGGCLDLRHQLEQKGIHLPLPSKDEIAIVNGHPLTLTQYFSIRSQMASHSPSAISWVGISSILVEDAFRKQGKSYSPRSPMAIARYALGELSLPEASVSLKEYYSPTELPSPNKVRKDLEVLAKQAYVQKNHSLLSNLN